MSDYLNLGPEERSNRSFLNLNHHCVTADQINEQYSKLNVWQVKERDAG